MPDNLTLSEDARRVLIHIRKMVYGDALHGIEVGLDKIILSPYRLEYIFLERGLPQYRLYERDTLIGSVRIHGASKLEETRQRLAIYLAELGFSPVNVRIIQYGAVTPMDAPVHRVPYLFPKYEAGKDSNTDKDGDDWT